MLYNSSSHFSINYSNHHFTSSITYNVINHNTKIHYYNGATNNRRTNYAEPNNRSTHNNYRNFDNNNHKFSSVLCDFV